MEPVSIQDRHAVLVRRVLAYGRSVAQRDLALENARAPDARVHLRKASPERLEYSWRCAVEFWKVDAGRPSFHYTNKFYFSCTSLGRFIPSRFLCAARQASNGFEGAAKRKI